MEATRKINITIEIEDSNFVENKLHQALDGLLGQSMIDYKVLPDTNNLYETDENFRKLCGGLKIAKQKYNDYINKTKLKQ